MIFERGVSFEAGRAVLEVDPLPIAREPVELCAMARREHPREGIPRSRGASIEAADHVAESTLGNEPRRFLSSRAENTGVVILVAAAMLAVAWFQCDRLQPPRKLNPDEIPGSGSVVQTEVVHVWMPEALRQLAGPPTEGRDARDHVDIRRLLEQRHQEHLRYAVTLRGHQVNGRHSDVTFVRRPYEDARILPEFLDTLKFVSGARNRDTGTDFSGASVHIVSEELLLREPAEIAAELQRTGAHQ